MHHIPSSNEYIAYPRSIVQTGEATFCLVRKNETGEKRLGVSGEASGFEQPYEEIVGYLYYPLSPANAAQLRCRLPWLRPAPLGLRTSFGFGDRLGLATPGHAQAALKKGLAPVYAQQSVRENARTGRTPQQVLDDAMWGVFQEGWHKPWGADADHIKRLEDLKAFVSAGYTFYTVDPGDHVDNAAQSDSLSRLREKVASLPWEALQSSVKTLYREYLERAFRLDCLTLIFDEETLLRAAAKYVPALAHAFAVYLGLLEGLADAPFDFEVSVDETELPTSIHEHFFIASELRRLGIRWTSLAPRFTGRFEKGVDFIGDLQVFDVELARHAAVMRYFGSYKLSLHSGSDKFSLYPLFAGHANGQVHVKTAGTSYLEALRVLAVRQPSLFRQILEHSRQRYLDDRSSYYVSAKLQNVPPEASLKDCELKQVLDQFDARQVLHVAYGSVLDQFGPALKSCLEQCETAYYQALQEHFDKHLASFTPTKLST